ncbi:MAG: alpha/beta hydrolase [Candidatus Omnitrophica bacterium]|nr:alpha/beta hydrolase [Candidatus Omnitrophota bacterium]
MFIFGEIKKGIAAGCSFLRLGKGPEKLVVFPPIYDSLFELADFTGYFRYLFRFFSKTHTVYLVSRKRRLPVGYLTRNMARDYAEVFSAEIGGPAVVMGISLGGLIAQYFAHDYPQYTKALIISGSAYRMGSEGLEIARRWIPWAREGQWDKIYQESMDFSYTGSHHFFSQLMKPYFVGRLSKNIKDPSDFIVSGQAGMLHDSLSLLPELTMPVLMLGGSSDRFFPESLLYEMKYAIKDSRLFVQQGTKHAVFEQNRKKISKIILEFAKRGSRENADALHR